MVSQNSKWGCNRAGNRADAFRMTIKNAIIIVIGNLSLHGVVSVEKK